MIKNLVITFFLMSFWSYGQDDSVTISWQLLGNYPLSENAEWSIDALENVYISEYGEINKYDSVGVLKFKQSIKMLGRMTSLVPVNTMKLVHFSEEQQTLCYFDNTLTSLDDCLDLSTEGIINASLISRSSQPNKLWIFDNINSSLLLLSLDKGQQGQEIENIWGQLGSAQVTQIAERSNRLYLLDPKKGVYVFDLYGSLIELIKIPSVKCVDAYANSVFLMKDDALIIYDLDTGDQMEIKLPLNDIKDFVYRNRHFFLRTKTDVHKFALQFSE